MPIFSDFPNRRRRGELLFTAFIALSICACAAESQPAVPPAIRGVVTDSIRGTPVEWAWVSLHGVETPNTPRVLVHTDSRGRYVFNKPPIGSTGITVHCPKSSRRPGVPVAVSGLDVQPATDTTMDFPIAMKSCNDLSEAPPAPINRRHVPSVPAPPLMSSSELAASKSAEYPSAEEAAMYTAALNATGAADAGEILLVARMTRSLCPSPDCADRYNKRIRLVPEVILSTMENFLAVRGKRLPIRPNFAGQSDLIDSYATRKDVVLIGDSAMKYLRKQANFPDSAHAPADFSYDSGYWKALHWAYPSAHALVTFSAVAFSPRRKQAFVEFSRLDRSGFTPSRAFVFNNVGGKWRMVAEF